MIRSLPLADTHESAGRLEVVDRIVLLSVWQMTNELRLTTNRLIDPQMQAFLFVTGVHLVWIGQESQLLTEVLN